MRKRYRNKDEIVADIDKWKRKSQALMDSAAALDYKADECYRNGMIAIADFSREQARAKRKSALRITERKLFKLKERMAEYLTDPLPGIGVSKDIQR